MRFLKGLTYVVLMSVIASGCSSVTQDRWEKSRAATYGVTGLVTLDGKPLENATITFHPKGEGGVAAYGVTGVSGTFQLTSYKANDGAAAGDYLVSITKHEPFPAPPGYNPDTSPPLPPPKLVSPVKYGDSVKSGLTASVASDGKNAFEFALVSK